MAADDTSGARPGPVVLRIKLRYDDVEAMVQRFAPNVGKSGLFLPTKSIQPIGTEVKFELRLANDTPVLVGVGRVKAVRAPDPARPKAAFGMAIELMRVTREGREVIIRMLERRRVLGLPEVAIPMPEDLEAARRSDVETAPRADTGGIVRQAMAQFASAPIAEQLLPAGRPSTRPIGIAREPSSRPTVAALAPEPAKPRRPRVGELIERARSGPVAMVAVPELDEHVDVAAAMVRARALARGEVDAELAALREASATPSEISVEAASSELARQLGGVAIARRERSARWAPPPDVTIAPSSTIVDDEPPSSGDDHPAIITEPSAAIRAVAVEDDAELGSFAHDLERVAAPARANADSPADHGDELVDDEHTQIGAMPIDPNAFGGHAYETMPSTRDELAAQIDAAAAEAESDFAIAMGQAPAGDEFDDEEISDLDVLAVADADDADLLNADGEADASGSHESQPAPPVADDDDFAARLDLGDDDSAVDRLRIGFDAHPHGESLRTSDPDYDPPSSSYTFAESYPDGGAHFEPPEGDSFDDPHGFAARDRRDSDPPTDTPIASPPRSARASRPTDDVELESALEALDVDLDELQVAHDPRRPSPRLPGLPQERPAATSDRVAQPTPARAVHAVQATPARPNRAVTEDGVLIDFDDDD